MLKRTVTYDEAELRVLGLANEKRKFCVPIDVALDPDDQAALERGMDNSWFTLIDVASVAAFPGRLMRVFRLTDAGMQRLADLQKDMAS